MIPSKKDAVDRLHNLRWWGVVLGALLRISGIQRLFQARGLGAG